MNNDLRKQRDLLCNVFAENFIVMPDTKPKQKLKTTIEFTDCRDCPFKYSHRGHGECWEQCNNPNVDEEHKGYGSILWGCGSQFSKIPEWCPVLKESKNDNKKPIIKIKNWRFGEDRLHGYVEFHPKLGFADGRDLATSRILKVETKNSIYELEGEAEK